MGHEDPTILHQPTVNELPLLDVYLTQVMGLVGGAKNLLVLLTSLLLEHQILLVSEGMLNCQCILIEICIFAIFNLTRIRAIRIVLNSKFGKAVLIKMISMLFHLDLDCNANQLLRARSSDFLSQPAVIYE